jgi:cellulose synthase (UDP-forming)
MRFYFVPAGVDACAPDASRSSARILGSSYLDLGGAVHYTVLPNLHLFAKAGFPFTRMADLSETAVLLPSTPGPEVMGLYLDLMGYFGAQTGYPALRLQVASPGDAARLTGKDLLVLGTFADLSSTPEINGRLPVTYIERSFTLSRRARWALLPDWLLRRHSEPWQILNGSAPIWPDGLLEGIESPFAKGRSIVVIAARDRSTLPGLASALLTTMPLDGIDSTVSLWTTGNFISYPLSTALYGSGDLPWYWAFAYWLPHNPFTLLVLLVTVLALLGVWARHWLAGRIRARLSLGQGLSAHGTETSGSFTTAT